MSRHRQGRYSLSQEFFPETKLVIIPEENASSNNQLDLSKQSHEDKQEANDNGLPKRRTVLDLVRANEKRLQQISDEKQQLEQRMSTRAKNKEIWKEKLERFKAKLKQKQEPGREVNAFFYSNKKDLEEIGIYSTREFSDYIKDDEDDWSSLDFQPNIDMNINTKTNYQYKKSNSSHNKNHTDQNPIVDFSMQNNISPINYVQYAKIPSLKGMIPKNSNNNTKANYNLNSNTNNNNKSINTSQSSSFPKLPTINYQQNIISSINAMSVPQYTLSSNLINDPSFLDVICINCYEIVKFNHMDQHSQRCIAPPIKDNSSLIKENTFDDCNSRMYKMYSSLKERSDIYLNSINSNLVTFYNELLRIVYQILINNNSIEELDESSLALNELLNTSLIKITGKDRAVFDIFCRRIVQLIYIKTIEMRKILILPNDSKENKETNQTSSEDNNTANMIHPEIVMNSNNNQRVSSHARIFSAHALSEIYSDIDDRRDDDCDYEDSSSISASGGSSYSSQGSFFQNNLVSHTHNYQDLSKGLQIRNDRANENSVSSSGIERISYSPMHQKFYSLDLTKH